MLRKELVATVCLGAHQVLPNSGWLSRFAVHPKYSDTQMAKDMIASVVQFCVGRAYVSLEIVTTECQFKDRETLIQMGYVRWSEDIIEKTSIYMIYYFFRFVMKQIYHQKVMANVSIMKSQLRYDLIPANIQDETPLLKVVTHS